MKSLAILLLLFLLSVAWAAMPVKGMATASGEADVEGFHATVEANGSVEVNATPTQPVLGEGNTGNAGKKIPIEIVVDRELNAEEMNEIEKMAREAVEKNVPYIEKNGIRVEKTPGGTVRVKVETKGVELNVFHRLGMEINVEELRERGEWKKVIRVENRVIVKVAKMEKNAGVVVAKEVTFDEENGTVEGNIAVAAETSGVFLVEENIPKGAEIDVNADYLVLNFDPVIAWVVELNQGEATTVSYRIRSSVPPELAPTVERLASCDVEVVVSKLVERGKEVSGQFQILLGGTPVYTKDVKLNGEWSFVKDGMYYVFQGEKPLVIEGTVGECSFYKEIGSREEGKTIQQVLLAIVLIGLVAAAYLLFRG